MHTETARFDLEEFKEYFHDSEVRHFVSFCCDTQTHRDTRKEHYTLCINTLFYSIEFRYREEKVYSLGIRS